MAKAKTTEAVAAADVLTKVRVSFGMAFSFEAEGREAIVLDAYQRALDAFLAVTPKEKQDGR
jgi:hypothetical protein